MIHFVGAGPGAVDLITVRGMEYLKQADVIIYAGSLVNPALLSYACESCRIYNSAFMTLEEVLRVMEEAETAGLQTVRLHTGDPAIYGAIREQMDALEARHIPYDVCPGVSALFGAAAALRCEYTLPGVSQTVIISRAEGRTPVPERERLRSLAEHQATMALYLSAGLTEQVQHELLYGGYAADTPVAVVYKATWEDEKIVHTVLGKLREDTARAGITGTALIIVGNVLGQDYQRSKLYDASFSTEYRKASKGMGGRRILMLACSKKGYVRMMKLRDMWLASERAAGHGDGREDTDREETGAEETGGKAQTEFICKVKCRALPELSEEGSIEQIVGAYFRDVDAVIFFAAAGIAVRTIAPYIRHKASDPAVLSVDETGKYCIALLSGHAGGANALAEKVSALIGTESVVTTATDREGCFAVDVFARQNGLAVTDWSIAKEISAAVLRGESVRLVSDRSIVGALPAGVEPAEPQTVRDGLCIWVSHKRRDTLQAGIFSGQVRVLQLVPRCVILGIGCRKDISAQKIEYAVADCLERHGIHPRALCAVTSIDIKRQEQGLLKFCESREVPLVTYTADELRRMEGAYTGSAFVEDVTGVDNVCERSAAAYDGKASFICRKTVYDGVTVALMQKEDACVYMPYSNQLPAVCADAGDGTIRDGKLLYVVGLGPGGCEGMTQAAAAALASCEVIAGYRVYVELIRACYPDKEYIVNGMRQEAERCKRALESADAGRVTAVVCSGDAGVYGMAGLVLELGRAYPDVEVVVVSGVTAALAGGAVLGAPLGHDFAVCSLSDLLTPWEQIENRLRAAASADFAICLYNPASRKRRDYLRRACEIIMEFQSGDTVCGYVQNIGREGERARLLHLSELGGVEVDMFTTVFIGNSRTMQIGAHMVTPRGYREV